MLSGLKEGQEKMSKSDPDSAIFMEDTAGVDDCGDGCGNDDGGDDCGDGCDGGDGCCDGCGDDGDGDDGDHS